MVWRINSLVRVINKLDLFGILSPVINYIYNKLAFELLVLFVCIRNDEFESI
jgi:hypothetical protein